MNNSNVIKVVNENGVEKEYGQIPDLWHIAGMIRDGEMYQDQDQRSATADAILQVWNMAHDLKSAAERQKHSATARVSEVRGMNTRQLGQLDQICQFHTGFHDFFDLVDSHQDYRPSVDMGIPEMRILADAYDSYQEEHGDDRRAYRFGGQ